MGNIKATFNGKVGQVITGGDIKRIDTRITFDDDGNMIVESDITMADDGKA